MTFLAPGLLGTGAQQSTAASPPSFPCATFRKEKRNSLMGRLIRLYPGRPAFVDGVCISVHDGFYLSRRALLRRKILEAPPGSRRRLMEAIAALRAFEAAEREWYRAFDLKPPDPGKVALQMCKVGHVLEPGQRPSACVTCDRARRKAAWRRAHPKRPLSMTPTAIAMRAYRAKVKRIGCRVEDPRESPSSRQRPVARDFDDVGPGDLVVPGLALGISQDPETANAEGDE